MPECDSGQREAYLTLALVPGIGFARLGALLERFEAPSGVLAAPLAHLAEDADTSALNAIQVKERETVLQLLDEHRWNVSNVAKVLGISRNTLYRKMHRLHIRLSHDTPASDNPASDA